MVSNKDQNWRTSHQPMQPDLHAHCTRPDSSYCTYIGMLHYNCNALIHFSITISIGKKGRSLGLQKVLTAYMLNTVPW